MHAIRGFLLGMTVAAACCAPTLLQARDKNPPATVGIEGSYFLRYDGPALEAKTAAEKAPLVLRVADVTQPQPGARLYELRFIAAVAGSHDLRDYLVRVDRQPLGEVPSAPVTVHEVLPANHSGELERLNAPAVRRPWPYRTLIALGAALWTLPLLWSIGRRLMRPRPKTVVTAPAPRTLADQLQPLVEEALIGTLDAHGQAQLEDLLVAFWQRRLKLDGTPGEILSQLGRHTEAGELVRALERWLYQRPVAGAVDLAALLAPYRAAPVELGRASATSSMPVASTVEAVR